MQFAGERCSDSYWQLFLKMRFTTELLTRSYWCVRLVSYLFILQSNMKDVFNIYAPFFWYWESRIKSQVERKRSSVAVTSQMELQVAYFELDSRFWPPVEWLSSLLLFSVVFLSNFLFYFFLFSVVLESNCLFILFLFIFLIFFLFFFIFFVILESKCLFSILFLFIFFIFSFLFLSFWKANVTISSNTFV